MRLSLPGVDQARRPLMNEFETILLQTKVGPEKPVADNEQHFCGDFEPTLLASGNLGG